jgi:hypothetical protein
MASPSGKNDIEDFQRLILKDLNFEAFRVLEKEIGEEKAREIFEPHMRNSGSALIQNSQKFLGLEIKDILSFIYTTYFINKAIWGALPPLIEITENRIETSFPECDLMAAPNSLKRMVCKDTIPGLFGAYTEDYEYQGFCIDMGDKECKFLWRNKHDPSLDWKKAGSKDTIIPAPVFDDKKVREFGVLALGELWLFPTQALIEWKGLDAIARLSEAIGPLGRKWGKELVRVTGESGKDMASLLSIFDTYNTIMGQEGRTVFTGANKNEAEITICPFSVAPAEMGEQCGKAIGAQCEAFCSAVCETVNPDFELLFTSKMCGGNQNCHRVIRKKLSARAAKERQTAN